jgi:16S rRNA (adenine1518-N6/adenine1519-N6)-dimethyltransferase
MSSSAQALLRAYGLHPKKRLGQNFLSDPAAMEQIVAAADLTPAETVVEVGAGTGTLTRALAQRAGRVLAIELDEGLVDVLRARLADLPHVQIVHGDILRLSVSRLSDPPLCDRGFAVVGNLPYYITSAVLRRFLEKAPRPSRMVVTVQREVAERVVAVPGDMSLLAVSVQFYGQPRIVARIPPAAFYPPPDVESAVLRIDVAAEPPVVVQNERAFFRAVRAGFGQKRKTLRNSLSAGLGLDTSIVEQALRAAGIEPSRRAESLGLEEWARATQALSDATELPK